jgi:hypothetical protein
MADPYARIRILGTLPGGEEWSIGVAFTGDFDTHPMSSAALQAWATAVAALNTGKVFGAVWGGLLSTVGFVTTVRAEYYATGTTLSDVREALLTTPAAGTGTPSKTYQSAVVVSLLSGIPGRRTRGRIYLPALAATLSSTTLRLAPTLAQSISDEASNWLLAVQDAGPTEPAMVPAIWSSVNASAIAVSSVRVGDVLDTQRRRRDSLAETYYSTVFPL